MNTATEIEKFVTNECIEEGRFSNMTKTIPEEKLSLSTHTLWMTEISRLGNQYKNELI
jgi:hypothetical protein